MPSGSRPALALHLPAVPPRLSIDDVRARLAAPPPRVIVPDGGWARAAVALVFRQGPSGVELLFIQRAVHEADPWSGHVGFPGGREEADDADLVAVAARETREELGMDLEGDRSFVAAGPLDQLQARARNRLLPMLIAPFAFIHVGADTPLLRPNDEVDDAFWIPMTRLADPAFRVWFPHPVAAMALDFPGVDLGPGRRVLWGLTWTMTAEVLVRLGLAGDAASLVSPRESGRAS